MLAAMKVRATALSGGRSTIAPLRVAVISASDSQGARRCLD
jgi:hypothetical protein